MQQSSTRSSHHRSGPSHGGAALALIGIGLALVLLVASAAWAAIGLNKFEAKAQGSAIVVTWETQTEA